MAGKITIPDDIPDAQLRGMWDYFTSAIGGIDGNRRYTIAKDAFKAPLLTCAKAMAEPGYPGGTRLLLQPLVKEDPPSFWYIHAPAEAARQVDKQHGGH